MKNVMGFLLVLDLMFMVMLWWFAEQSIANFPLFIHFIRIATLFFVLVGIFTLIN